MFRLYKLTFHLSKASTFLPRCPLASFSDFSSALPVCP